MASLRDALAPKGWPDAGTPEFWEQFGCEGAHEYQDCHEMSQDYARLRRLERRMEALAENYEEQERNEGHGGELWSTTAAAIRRAMREPDDD